MESMSAQKQGTTQAHAGARVSCAERGAVAAVSQPMADLFDQAAADCVAVTEKGDRQLPLPGLDAFRPAPPASSSLEAFASTPAVPLPAVSLRASSLPAVRVGKRPSKQLQPRSLAAAQHLDAASRLSRQIRTTRRRSPEQVKTGRAICQHLLALLREETSED